MEESKQFSFSLSLGFGALQSTSEYNGKSSACTIIYSIAL
jgi:hypothetical protein